MAKRPQQNPKTNQQRRDEACAPMTVESGKRRGQIMVAALTGQAPRSNRYAGEGRKRYDRRRERTVRGFTQE